MSPKASHLNRCCLVPSPSPRFKFWSNKGTSMADQGNQGPVYVQVVSTNAVPPSTEAADAGVRVDDQSRQNSSFPLVQNNEFQQQFCPVFFKMLSHSPSVMCGNRTLRELGHDLPFPGRFVLNLLQLGSEQYLGSLRVLCLLSFSVLLALKLENIITASWITVFIPLYIFSAIYLLEMIVFFFLWSYTDRFEEIQQRDSKAGIDSLRLWKGNVGNSGKVHNFTTFLGQFSYAVGNTHRTACMEKCCFKSFFSLYGGFAKATQVLSCVAYCIILPYVLEFNLGLNWRIPLFVLFLWYSLFLLWSFYELAVRTYHMAHSNTEIGSSSAFSITMALCIVTLLCWVFIALFFQQFYWIGSIPAFAGVVVSFCFPCWLCGYRETISTSPDYYGPIAMDDPGNCSECMTSIYFFAPQWTVVLLTVLFITLKLESAITWSWMVVGIPLWIILATYTVVSWFHNEIFPPHY
jgi:hypothetical protein